MLITLWHCSIVVAFGMPVWSCLVRHTACSHTCLLTSPTHRQPSSSAYCLPASAAPASTANRASIDGPSAAGFILPFAASHTNLGTCQALRYVVRNGSGYWPFEGVLHYSLHASLPR
jgi:hypothetical protein